jgi:hypothetical protein
MDKDTERKLQQLWRNRFLVTISIVAVFGFSILQIRTLSQTWKSESQLSEKAHVPEAKVSISQLKVLRLDENSSVRYALANQDLRRDVTYRKGECHDFVQMVVLQRSICISLKDEDSPVYIMMTMTPTPARTLTLLLLSISLITLISLVFLLRKLRASNNLSFHAQLIAFLPEECIAELNILLQRMKKAKASPWEIRLRLLTEFLTLLWVFYIQIKFENLWLPSDNHEIDD